ncbi:MAG: septal ring lytic transglycosylase RlpA family protein [Acidobacteriaceae bacterium]|nr:septal ring lytic transglycosylase RlpA family protein [Acidobacteriaceae bacterium]MBV9222885.1 septal ring lytic transglycosylase RlpA family protein [Acidobacteriaceae bacterium]MBV9306933.1 septal ring lytic transglycosylase RlpA family protein [Acidobacteriaceae bacterium]
MHHRALLGLLLSLCCSAQVTDRPSSIPWKRQRSAPATEQSSTTIAPLSQTRKPAPWASGASQNREQTGLAAYYSPQMDGQHTASGEPVNSQALTAAHPSYPLGARVRVTNVANGKSVIVRINDRASSGLGRIITVTQRAAEELGFVKSGTARVRLEIISDRE